MNQKKKKQKRNLRGLQEKTILILNRKNLNIRMYVTTDNLYVCIKTKNFVIDKIEHYGWMLDWRILIHKGVQLRAITKLIDKEFDRLDYKFRKIS